MKHLRDNAPFDLSMSQLSFKTDKFVIVYVIRRLRYEDEFHIIAAGIIIR